MKKGRKEEKKVSKKETTQKNSGILGFVSSENPRNARLPPLNKPKPGTLNKQTHTQRAHTDRQSASNRIKLPSRSHPIAALHRVPEEVREALAAHGGLEGSKARLPGRLRTNRPPPKKTKTATKIAFFLSSFRNRPNTFPQKKVRTHTGINPSTISRKGHLLLPGGQFPIPLGKGPPGLSYLRPGTGIHFLPHSPELQEEISLGPPLCWDHP